MTTDDRRAYDLHQDEWVSAKEAAEILGVGESTVHRMAHRGLIQRGSGYRRYHRPALEALRDRGEAISIGEAARILGRPSAAVRDLIAADELPPSSNATFPLFRRDVESYAESHPPPDERAGQLNAKSAARVLDCSVSTVLRLARSDRVPCDRDTRGRY
ncbi:DNA-binding protein [Kribbella capetownensis]|uniref:DNA-binding protein n=1 Tax=Kribbella capetownensis TaxID=1572659 RepID=A0A4R0INN1_9ACTN|nr:DNA-binding protein [Kribbella capetownensis]